MKCNSCDSDMNGPYAAAVYMPWPSKQTMDAIKGGDVIELAMASIFKPVEMWECQACGDIKFKTISNADALLFPVVETDG